MNSLVMIDQGFHSETRKMAGWYCGLQFLKRLKLHTKLVPVTVH